jgi:hypothetical protein
MVTVVGGELFGGIKNIFNAYGAVFGAGGWVVLWDWAYQLGGSVASR